MQHQQTVRQPQPQPTTAEPGRQRREIVSFHVAGRDFSIDIGYIREIRGWSPTTVLPHAPEYLKGVMNLRGAVIPVMDLALRLGLGPAIPTERHVVIIAVLGRRTVGLLVEAVSDIIEVETSDLQPMPDLASDPAREVIEGIITRGNDLIRLLAIDRVFPAGTDSVP